MQIVGGHNWVETASGDIMKAMVDSIDHFTQTSGQFGDLTTSQMPGFETQVKDKYSEDIIGLKPRYVTSWKPWLIR